MSNNEWDEELKKIDEKKEEEPIEVGIGESEFDRPQRPSGGKSKFQAWEDEVIRGDWMHSTDAQLAEKLSRSEEAIYKRRKILGLRKPGGKPRLETRKDAIFDNPTEYNLSRLSKEDRIKFYKTKFNKNLRFPWLERTLLPDELEYYQLKYIEIIESLDTLTSIEEDLLHNMIMKEIQIIRMQEQIKTELQRYSDDESEDKRPPQQWLYKDLQEAEKQYVSYQEKLKLTREQRLKTDNEEKVNISTLVRSYLDSINREKAGNLAGEIAFAASKCKEDMSKMRYLLGE